MKDIYSTIHRTNEDLVLIFILDSGKTDIKTGVFAVYGENTYVSVNLETEDFIVEEAQNCLSGKISYIKTFEEFSGLKAYFMYINKNNRSIKSIGARAVKYLEKPDKIWMILDISDEINWKINIYNNGSALTDSLPEGEVNGLLNEYAVFKETDGKKLFSDPLKNRE